MKYLKEYSNFELFEESELLDIKDIYIDMIDELNLIDSGNGNTWSLLGDKALSSFFSVDKEKVKISIKISNVQEFLARDGLFICKEDRIMYNDIIKKITQYSNRFKKMGYEATIKDENLKLPSGVVIIGIKIEIKKQKIEEYSKFLNDEIFTDEEYLDIKDMYIDLIDDLGLTDIDEHPCFQHNTKPLASTLTYFSKISGGKFMISVIIKTASLDDYDDYGSYAISSSKDRNMYNKVLNDIRPFIERLKSMGYVVYRKDIDVKIDSWKHITSGIKINITK
jgi:hypothetical protein